MTDPSLPESRRLSLSQLGRVIEIRERYESAWRAGQRVGIDAYLAESAGPERDALRAELVALERELRREEEARATAGEKVETLVWSGHPDEAAASGAPFLDDGPYLGCYRDLGEIGRGGMGVVHRVRDLTLHRDLALKALLRDRSEEAERRFIEEAQVVGQLQHPGVPPLHELGRLSDGRPYFTMKLIKGHTLRQLLSERPSTDADLPRFVAVFEQVAQTIAYAHSKRVLHRDLKPSNVMVGTFGEVQVMDWGLAKVLKPDRARDARLDTTATAAASAMSAIRTNRASAADAETHAGALLGTPAYMAPEQARGELDEIDERSDVFGLGAILCEILSGQPPYVGRSSDEVRRKAARADLADAMAGLDSCVADAELIDLVRACLAPEPLDRPRDASEVAEAISAYQAGVAERLRLAELARVEEHGRAEHERKARVLIEARVAQERRARRLTAALAASVLAMATLAGTSLWSTMVGMVADYREAARAKRQDLDVASAIAKHREAIRRKPDAIIAHYSLGRALAISGDVAGAIAALREAIRIDPDLAIAHHRLGLALATTDEALYREAIRLNRNDALAHHRLGIALAIKGDVTGTIAEYREAVRLKPDDALAHQSLGIALAIGGTDGIRTTSTHWGENHINLRDNHHSTPGRSRNEQDVAVLREAIRLKPDDAMAHYELGRALGSIADPTGERSEYVEAIRLRPDLAIAHHWLAHSLENRGDVAGAIAEYRRAIRHTPNDATVHEHLGTALYATGDVNGAIAEYRVAIGLNPDLAVVHHRLGLALTNNRDFVNATLAFREAVRLKPEANPDRYYLGVALAVTGDETGAIAEFLRIVQTDPDDALAHYDLSRALAKKDAVACREAIRRKPNDASAHHSLGLTLATSGDLAGAIDEFRAAIRLKPAVDIAHHSLGRALELAGDAAGAIAEYRRASAVQPDNALVHYRLGLALATWNVAAYQAVVRLRPDEALAHHSLGLTLAIRGDPTGATHEYYEAVRREPVTGVTNYNAEYPEDLRSERNDATAHTSFGDEFQGHNDLVGAIAEYRQAIGLKPQLAAVQFRLGFALASRGDVGGAIAAYREVIRLDPGNAPAHNNLGNALHTQGDAAGAAAEYREVIRLRPADASARYRLGLALQAQDDVAGAIAEYREVIRLRPNYAEAHCSLGGALRKQGEYAESLFEFRRGHELGSKRENWTFASAEWVGQAERLASLASRLPAILKDDLRPGDSAERLDLGEIAYRAKRYAAAARLYAEVLEAEPKLADHQEGGHRYNAACAAALAGDGKGKDDPPPDEADRAKYRRQARDWLRADLVLLRGQFAASTDEPRRRASAILRHWKSDADLAGVRDDGALAQLSAEEHQAWRDLWGEVDALLATARGDRL